VYLFDISRSGLKNILVYSMKATSVPSPTALRMTSPPPNHRMSATVNELNASTAENRPAS
jgi:hypothetical protein